jgi:hypothetical protein
MENEAARDIPPEADALFVVTVNGPAAAAEIVQGLEEVREAFLRCIWRGPRDAVPDDLDRQLASLEDAAAWAVHGQGDGKPFWHWWTGFADGSVSVQRITAALPAEDAGAAGRSAGVDPAACAAALREAARQLAEAALAVGQARRFAGTSAQALLAPFGSGTDQG